MAISQMQNPSSVGMPPGWQRLRRDLSDDYEFLYRTVVVTNIVEYRTITQMGYAVIPRSGFWTVERDVFRAVSPSHVRTWRREFVCDLEHSEVPTLREAMKIVEAMYTLAGQWWKEGGWHGSLLE